jgi:hypothetical protein
MNGFPIAAGALDLEIYELACTTAASGALHGLGKTHSGIRWLTKTFERSELSRRLIALAVTVRNMDEGKRSPNARGAPVGTLIPDENQPNRTEPLNLREACNKIIHAQDVDFFPDIEDVNEDTPLFQTIKLWGSKGGKHWIAKLDLIGFVEATTARV